MADLTFAIRAASDNRFYRRFILMGVGALGFAAYCVYDGSIAYPKKQKIYDAYEAIPELDRVEQWPDVAVANGWPADTKVPKKRYSNADIMLQFVMAVPIFLVGLWFLVSSIMARGRWIEASEAGVTSSWGQGFAWEEVTRLDKKKWRSKGIAKVAYTTEGRSKSFVIDDYKFMRAETDEILASLEDRIDREKIVNGPTEAEVREAEERMAEQNAEEDFGEQLQGEEIDPRAES